MRRTAVMLSASCSALALMIAGPPALAQNIPQETQEQATGLDEIIVTARRRSENVQRTPVAVTALGSEALDRAQITDVVGLQRAVPNLAITTNSTGGASATSFSIRGQVNLGGAGANDPAVGLYVDNVYIGRPGGSLVDLIDVSRVEVLRGPQGTLFGRNTTGGAVNIITNQPVDGWEGSLQARTGSYNLREATGILNAPLIPDRLAARLVAQVSERDGFGTNQERGIDVGDRKNIFLRPSVKYTSADGDMTFVLAGDYTDYEDHGQMFVLRGYNPANTFLPQFLAANGAARGDVNLDRYLQRNVGERTNNSNEIESSNVTVKGVSGVLEWDLGWADLKSVSAYREVSSRGRNDLDATPYRLLTTDYDFGQHQVSQELQLSGTAGALGWIGGAFYFEETSRENTKSINYITTVLTGGQRRSFNDAELVNTSYAVFGQVYYDLSDRLKLTAGLRQTRDTRKTILLNFSTLDPTPVCAVPVASRDDGVTCRQTLEKDFDYLSYLVSVDFQASDNVFVYAKTSRAFLAGGFNARSDVTTAFEPESVTDVEAGIKVEWFDRRLRTNLAVFYGKQSNLQRTATSINPLTGQPAAFLQNAGEAHIQGLEFELAASPWTGMEVKGSVGVLDAVYDEFSDRLNIGTVTAPVLVDVDRTGETPLQAPELTWSLDVTQRFSVALGQITLHGDYGYTGDQTYFTVTPSPAASAAVRTAAGVANQLAFNDAHGVFNAQIELALASAPVTVALWGRNLGDTLYYNRTYADLYGSLGWALAFPAAPRTYGVTATYKF